MKGEKGIFAWPFYQEKHAADLYFVKQNLQGLYLDSMTMSVSISDSPFRCKTRAYAS